MTYEQARKFIEQTTKFGSVLGLVSMNALMDELGNVQNTVPIIHIAGTNGKGSVGAYLAAILKEAGLKVGRYCSPAVFHPLECWQYDGRMITEEEYAAIMSQVKEACDIVVSKGIQPTVFEVETAAAFLYFSQMPTDILLLETGLGGETDATNVVKHPLACVFTNISRDHMQFLGETLTEIATVKAGIIKAGAKVFSAKQQPEVEDVLKRYYNINNSYFRNAQSSMEESMLEKNCFIKKQAEEEATNQVCFHKKHEEWSNFGKQSIVRENQQEIKFVDEEKLHLISQTAGELVFSYKGVEYTTQLSGSYQMKNAALSIEVAEEMLDILCIVKTETQMALQPLKNGNINQNISKADTRNNICNQKASIIRNGIKNTFWPGRFEVLTKDPLCIMDGAHNEDAACMLLRTLENCFTKSSLVYIIGVLADKEHKQMLKIMQTYANKVYTITPPNARALDAKALAEEAKEFYQDVTACESIEQAVTESFIYAREHEKSILAFGSLSYLAELKDAIYGMISECRTNTPPL